MRTLLRRTRSTLSRTDRAARLATVLVVLAVAISAVAALPAASALQENDTGTNQTNATTTDDGAAPADNETVAVVQGGTCYEVQALGDGTQNVSQFYEYRTHSGMYSSQGTTDIQIADTSQVFFYQGSDGLSMVVLHDETGSGDRTGGGAVSANVTGLPVDGEWVVRDDQYGGEDDLWNLSGSSAEIHWAWSGNRTDGAVFQGLDSQNWENITVEFAFNEQAQLYPYEKWQGEPAANRVDALGLRTANGSVEELAMDEPITVVREGCPSQEEPTTTADGTPGEGTEDGSTATDGGENTDQGGPGFTPIAALVALLSAGLLLARRNR